MLSAVPQNKKSPLLAQAQDMLFSTWIPAWATRFADRVHGGFHERLDGNGVPLTGIPRRLVTQCRQIYVYAHADLTTGRRDYADLTASAFEYLLTHYRVPETGGFRFSVMADGTEVDGSYDLYGHAFLVFACTYYYRVSEDPRALEAARGALQLINTKFRMAGKPGFAEALDAQLNPIPRMRRQDPHMHLFEACLFMYRITNEEPYLAMAKEIVDLFTDYFWDAKSKTLPEFYDDDLKPHPEKGEISQPGHHFQWIWLFEKFQETRRKKNPYYYQLMEELFTWADRHGFDPAYGGIYDALDINGDIISDTKRIWPIMEALKAYPVINRMHDDPHYCTRRASDLVTLLQAHYLREDGTWTEHLSRDMKPLMTDMPGTTPYHIYLGIAALSEIE